MTPFLVSDKWYDIRDLGNLSREILEAADRILPFGVVYVLAALIGFVASFLLFVLPSQLIVGVYGERRIIGRMQSRLGPNRVGPFGLLQPIADAIKLIQKEALTPTRADRAVMYIAPIVFVMPAVLLWAVIPFGENMVIADIPVSLMYFLAVSSLPVIATFMAGWSANNKYSLFGAMRIVSMAISYESPLVLALLGAVVMTGTISLSGMVAWADEFNIWMVFVQPLALVIYFICVSAELNRTPVDIAEAESEIVAGYLTEYSGMKWGLFYGMDIGYALAASGFAATVFLGGWTFFGLEQWVPGWLIFIAKTHLFYFLFIWTRGTLPRLRADQLMAFAWKFLLPLGVFNLLIVSTERMLWSEQDYAKGLIYVFALVNIVLSVALVYAWARFNGYRPEQTPTRPRLVKQAGGYIPVGERS
ncbi:NADH-quinone oxidoreductase subunit NuoH [Tepidiforma flava]|uniref:NADH-quinone oxidoreductase subunit H n=1 Tax=Tepidiforma flava TaxID=3004094 RepID=A0ABY7M768_9CHLR|nr:NADH-quinone oxidoreductase subunit NuoH [Tepidiforma flava]WBL35997.1 NADH-quinone oxidoreductase subunit NuoH [Tepidiforma flava]